MTTGQIGLAVLIGMSVVISLIAHVLDRQMGRATLVSTVVSIVAFEVWAFYRDGYIDPFFLIGLVIGTFIAAVISALIGWVFMVVRAARAGRI